MKDSTQRVYSTYGEAMDEVERIKSRTQGQGAGAAKMVTKVQKSRYGDGFTVRTFPARFLFHPRLKRLTSPVDYESL